jgi:hypothetical protein
MRGANDVPLLQVNATRHSYRFLSSAYIYTADNLALSVEFALDTELQLAG